MPAPAAALSGVTSAPFPAIAPAIAPFTAPPALSGDPKSAIPDALTDQAAAWADHVLATHQTASGPGLAPQYVTRKALDAVAFSLRHGLRHLSVPSKLVGVKAHQNAVQALALDDQRPLRARPRLVVSHTLAVYAVRSDGSLQPVGRIQPKHAAWLAPLVTSGATVHLIRVSGLARRAQGLPVTLGVNVRVSGLARALRALTSGGGEAAPAMPAGAVSGALEVRLWRDASGTAQMSCPHVVRHSPSGPEWGYGGSGPADCARSVLLALTDSGTAEAHYQAFKAEVVAALPEPGAVIQRTAVLAWLAGRADARLAA